MSIASQIERLQGVRKEINTKLQELKLTDTDKDFQGISDTLNTVVTNPVINDTLTVTKTSLTVPKGFYDTEGTVNIVTEEKTATTNGEVIPTEGKVLGKVIVNVPITTVKLQEKTATPSQAEQVISPDSGYDGLSKVTINGDSDLVATNIKQGVNIFGIEGTYQGEQAKLQEKTATPSKEQQVINADEGYDGLSQVTINGDEDLIADNIKKDVNIFGVVGTYEGSGGGSSAELVGLIDRSITSITVPSDVTEIGDGAFHYCRELETVNFTGNIVEIGSEAFSYCLLLNISTLPDSVKIINSEAFSTCKEITTMRLPTSLTNIYSKAFVSCMKLSKIWIPDTCTSISAPIKSQAPFYTCHQLKDIYTSATEKPVGWEQYFNYTDSSTQATVHYGVSKEEFDAIIGGA